MAAGTAAMAASEETAAVAAGTAAAATGVVGEPVQQQIACQQQELHEVRAELQHRCDEAKRQQADLEQQWQLLSGCQHQYWQRDQQQQQQLGHLHQQMHAMWAQQQRQLNLWQHDGACACIICLQGHQNRSLESQVKQLQQQVEELTLQLERQQGSSWSGAAVSAEQVQQMVKEQTCRRAAQGTAPQQASQEAQ